MLRLEDVHTRYGRVEALKGVTIDVERGEIVTIIGANGAGKSTLLMTVCGSPAPAPAASSSRARTSAGWPPTTSSTSASASRPRAGASSRA
jgi:branched-chain amino acid transport system ATP-binding protein